MGKGMRDKVTILQLSHDEAGNVYQWEPLYTAWAGVQTDTKNNLFSAVGIGARGVTLTMWKNPRLTLHHAIRLKSGQFCFLTSIIPMEDGIHSTVQAALCTSVTCKSENDVTFPGILTEKYLGQQRFEPQSVNTTTFVLVTSAEISMDINSLVWIGGKSYEVQVSHVLDEFKHEFEISRREDA